VLGIWLVTAAPDVFAACSDFGTPASTHEIACWNRLDDDLDFALDCDDPDCAGSNPCAPPASCGGCWGHQCGTHGEQLAGGLSCWCGVTVSASGDVVFGTGVPECWLGPDGDDLCADNMDNDGDDAVDCADTACTARCSGTPEICANGADDDQDGATDCADGDCAGTAACLAATVDVHVTRVFSYASAPTTVNVNASIGASGAQTANPAVFTVVAGQPSVHVTDVPNYTERLGACIVPRGSTCTASSTLIVPSCAGGQCTWNGVAIGAGRIMFVRVLYLYEGVLPSEIDCNDDLDEDQDGVRDCADPDCQADASCGPETECHDNVDSDQDGLTDCSDPDCFNADACEPPATCGSCWGNQCTTHGAPTGGGNSCWCGVEVSGSLDVVFGTGIPECWLGPKGQDLCADGTNNDQDGFVDCADSDCSGRGVCQGDVTTDVFARGVGFELLHGTFNRDGWSGWTDLGDVTDATPAAASWGPGRVDVFYKGLDGLLHQKTWTAISGWFAGNVPADEMTTGPDATAWGPNRLDVVYRGNDGRLKQRVWQGGLWYGPFDLGVSVTISKPAITSWGPNRLDVFANSAPNAAEAPPARLVHRAWDGAAWTPWQEVGPSGGLAAVAWNGSVKLFRRDPADQHLYQRWWTSSAGWTPTWFDHVQTMQYSPAVSAPRTDLFDAWGTDLATSALVHKRWNVGGTDTPWVSHPGVLTSGPAAVARTAPIGPVPTGETCSDGMDNDLDYRIDCDCVSDSACPPAGEPSCSNRLDDDQDGATDCTDPQCRTRANCTSAFIASIPLLLDDDAPPPGGCQ
jgi:hypothetical protein